MSTGATKPCTANITGSGVCNFVMVQRVINAARGASCGHTATLTWVASVSPNVAGYKIYRSIVNGSSYALLTTTAVAGTTYVDGTVQGGLTYYYVVTAIDANNKESGYSNQVTALVPSP
jgi:fibronectin type 3 domain-containing protein